MRSGVLIPSLFAVLLAVQVPVWGHAERDATFPDGSGSVPEYRSSGPYLVVCKEDSAERIAQLAEPLRSANEALLAECGFGHIQAAVDAVAVQGTRIMVLPGVYREEPTAAPYPEGHECAALDPWSILSYEDQVACPHVQNLIAVLGDDLSDDDPDCTGERLCGLQIEGTGAVPEDVLIDVAWSKLNGVRADRADGFYIKNLVIQRTEFNSLYIMETDGFVIDTVVARWNWEYGILTFAVDHGLYKDCEAYGNGDAGLYPGSASDLHGARHSVEITGCDVHHNMAGYSGTAGNSVYVHDNDFHHNSVGIVMDSLFPGHPGMPQDSSRFVNNRIYSNNENFYDNFLGEDPPCLRPVPEMGIEEGVVCPSSPVPVGTAILVAGGNHNVFSGNQIWDNWRFAFMLFAVPAPLREEYDPAKALDTSHFNRFRDNVLGIDPHGVVRPNGSATWWDEGGAGNCWQDNEDAAGWESSPPGFMLPSCDQTPVQTLPNVPKLATIAPCALYDNPDNHHPEGCWWMNDPAPPGDPDLLWFEVWQPPQVKLDLPLAAPAYPVSESEVRSAMFDLNAWFHHLALEGRVQHVPGAGQGFHGPALG